MVRYYSFSIFLFLIFHFSGIVGQENLYMPKEIKRAYEKGTRSFDGKPGKNYFQNRTDYSIQAEFDPDTRLLQGKEKITYTNNSPDTLKSVVIRLYPDILKKGNRRNQFIDPNDVTDGVEIVKLIVKGVELEPEKLNRVGTNLIFRLPEPLPPDGATNFLIEWKYTFQANTNIREGRYHETTYFIAYWYPKVAVYDDIEGWNRHIYNGEQEFYNEYGDFDVKITVPENYLVWSSGIMQNGEDILNKKIWDRLENSKLSSDIIHVVDSKDIAKGKLTKKDGSNTWHFKAENLPDFAFALSNNYLWDATSLQLGNKRVHVNAVYHESSNDFHEVAEISKETIRLLSDSVMQTEFPYPQMTAFNGHFGMEFPMMVNDGDAENRNGTLFVTAHEITHSYFPFYVGTNEQKYAWMDEGLVTFLPKVIEDALSDDEGYHAFSQSLRTYAYYAGSKYDVPIMVPSSQLTGPTYMYISYSRAAVAFYVLQNILGYELFQKCLVEFIDRWRGKHPTGYDFFYTFENVSKQNLNWFWEPWFFEFGYPDLAINSIEQNEDQFSVEVERIGRFPAPVNLIITYQDGSEESVQRNANIWKDAGLIKYVKFITKKKVKKVEINTLTVPDTNPKNNIFIVDE